MRWENPLWLLGLWLLPLWAGLLVYAHLRQAAAARRFAQSPMVERLMPTADRLRPWLRGGLLLLGVALLIVAAARPRFGVYFEQVTSRGVDLFVVLDVSRSMLAEDVAPNRLGRAKSDIRDLLHKLPGDRVGLIAFAGAPSLIVPLTSDHGFFLSALEAVDTGSAPRGGSLIGDAIRKAVQSLPERRDGDQVIVLITDGEDHDSFPLEAAEQASERGIRIFTVGLGDPREGTRIPIRDESGALRYLEYHGEDVRSTMDERLLKEIALTTEGAYIPAQTRTYDLGQIYEEHLAGLTRREVQSEKRKRFAERFQWFVFFGIAMLVIQTLIPRYPRAMRSGSAASDLAQRRTSGASRIASTAALLL
ncbi:MAG: VWA domain-containing protein, partial [Planctomycetes bacterium]|nr:VWA domain-containing protein [Planctomycetota bacterium]